MIEKLLQFLISVIDAELLKAVELQELKGDAFVHSELCHGFSGKTRGKLSTFTAF